MATDVFPFSVWLSGTNQNSIPANDNALRVEVITGPALSILSAQPASPAEGDQHILGAAPTGAQWSSFGEDDVVIFKGGTWLAFEPYQGWLKFNADDGDTYQWNSGWTVFAGGSGGSTAWADLTGVPQPVLDIAALTDPGADRLLFWDDSVGAYVHLSLGTNLSITGTTLNASGAGAVTQCIPVACSDETTALTAGNGKVTFRMPFAMTAVSVRASLTTAQATGSVFTVDVNEGGVSILSTKITIDNTGKTSTTAATPPVVSDTSLADDAEITIDIDQVGDGTAAGLKVYLIGTV